MRYVKGKIKTGGRQAKNITGLKFNMLTAIRFSHSNKNKKFGSTKHHWVFRCDCGVEKTIWKETVVKGGTRSCGCLVRTLNNPKNRVLHNEKLVAKVYTQGAKYRSISFDLTFEEIRTFIYSECHYCGSPPSLSKAKGMLDNFCYNGIDRVDPNIGYNLVNCVSSCSKCNYAKHVLQYSEFKDWINKCYLHLNRK